MKKQLKQLVEALGGRIYSLAGLPKGVDLLHDLKRYGYLPHLNRVFDVGANVGNFSLELLKLKPDVLLHAFEPIEGTYNELKGRLAGHPSVHCHHCALGSEEATVPVILQNESRFNSLIEANDSIKEHANKTVENVSVKRLSDFTDCLNGETLDLLKTDTEGFDLEVLKGAKVLFEQNKVLLVYSEVGFHKDDLRHSSFYELSEMLFGYGFDLIGFYEQMAYRRFSGLDHANALFVNRKLAEKIL